MYVHGLIVLEASPTTPSTLYLPLFLRRKRMKTGQKHLSDGGSHRPTMHTWPPTQPHEKQGWRHPHKPPSTFQQGDGEGTCSTARQHGAPPQQPRHPRPHGPRHIAGFGLGQLSEELPALLGPSASHLAGEGWGSTSSVLLLVTFWRF